VIHAVCSEHNETVLDIEIGRSQFSDEIWEAVEAVTYSKIYFTLKYLQKYMEPLRALESKPGELQVFWYRTSEKLSIRASLGLLMNVRVQKYIIESLKSRVSSLDPRSLGFVYDLIITSIDTLVMSEGRSMRLPVFGKISVASG
jgi:hypothetical protein